MKYYIESVKSGKGLLNSMINKLPFELHIPTYNFCGPGTKLEKRLARGDKGVNGLDEACKQHDISYAETTDLKSRHDADKILAEKALTRFKAKDSSNMEKLAALGVAGAMKAKVKLGMAYDDDDDDEGLAANLNMNNCIKSMEKVKKSSEKSLENINTCLGTMQRFQRQKTGGVRKVWKRKQPKTKIIKNYLTHSGQTVNLDTISHSNEYPNQQQQQPSLLFNKYKDNKNNCNIKFSRKRKLDVENYSPFKKICKINNDNRNSTMKKKKRLNKILSSTTTDNITTTLKRKKRKLDIEKEQQDKDGPKNKIHKLNIRLLGKRKLNFEKDVNESSNKKSKIFGKKRKMNFKEEDSDPLKKIRKTLDRLPSNRKRKLTIKDGKNDSLKPKKIRKLYDTRRKRKLNIKEENEEPLRKIQRQLDILPSNRKRKLNIIQNVADGAPVKKIPKLSNIETSVNYDVLPVHRKRKYNYNDTYDFNGTEPIVKKPKII